MKQAATELILKELSDTLPAIDEGEFNAFVDELMKPNRRVLVMAVGRMLISMKAWVKRMKHLGIDINYVGDETEMPVGPDDLVVCASSSGESKLPVAIARLHRRDGRCPRDAQGAHQVRRARRVPVQAADVVAC